VLVITMDPATADRARRPIALDSAQWWRATVLDPEAIPRIEDPQQMQAHPTLGILSALAHAREAEDLPVAKAALVGLAASSLDPDLVGYYLRIMDAAFGPALRAALESSMELGEDIPPGPIGNFYLKRGREEGVEALVNVLRTLLMTRHIPVTEAQSQLIGTCPDLMTLQRWVLKAAFASSADEILS
jgi:hypothetical protein